MLEITVGSTMMYAVASFDDTDETDFMPHKWLAEDITPNEIPAVIANRRIVKFYWPPWKNALRLSKAKKTCQDAEISWPIYSCRILSTAGNYARPIIH